MFRMPKLSNDLDAGNLAQMSSSHVHVRYWMGSVYNGVSAGQRLASQ